MAVGYNYTRTISLYISILLYIDKSKPVGNNKPTGLLLHF